MLVEPRLVGPVVESLDPSMAVGGSVVALRVPEAMRPVERASGRLGPGRETRPKARV